MTRDRGPDDRGTEDHIVDPRLRRNDWHSSASLPLVSIIIVNYNYGRFLADAVASAFAQTYPNIECIAVDNHSTDDSLEILADLSARFPQMRVIRRAHNDGQTAASLDGLAASAGAYVIFVDADDFLLPHCADAHIYTHLSLRTHVGFTSGDMLQVADAQIVVASGEEFSRYIRSGKGRRPDLIRPFRAGSVGEWPAHELAERLDGSIHVVPPLHVSWVWSPTSGSCYRRDALTMFADNPALATLRTGTDMYFGHAIGALSGSALIDEPLFAYRIHGANIYSQRAQLDRTLCFRPGGHGDSNVQARLVIIDHLVAEAERFAPNIWLRLNLVALLIRLDHPDPDPTLPGWARRSRLARCLATDPERISEVLGPWLMGLLRVWSGVFWRGGVTAR